jgi:hypothetical protein
MSEYYGMKHTSELKLQKESIIDTSSVTDINIYKSNKDLLKADNLAAYFT